MTVSSYSSLRSDILAIAYDRQSSSSVDHNRRSAEALIQKAIHHYFRILTDQGMVAALGNIYRNHAFAIPHDDPTYRNLFYLLNCISSRTYPELETQPAPVTVTVFTLNPEQLKTCDKTSFWKEVKTKFDEAPKTVGLHLSDLPQVITREAVYTLCEQPYLPPQEVLLHMDSEGLQIATLRFLDPTENVVAERSILQGALPLSQENWSNLQDSLLPGRLNLHIPQSCGNVDELIAYLYTKVFPVFTTSNFTFWLALTTLIDAAELTDNLYITSFQLPIDQQFIPFWCRFREELEPGKRGAFDLKLMVHFNQQSTTHLIDAAADTEFLMENGLFILIFKELLSRFEKLVNQDRLSHNSINGLLSTSRPTQADRFKIQLIQYMRRKDIYPHLKEHTTLSPQLLAFL